MVTEKEIDELIKPPSADIEKITTISDDGKNLLTRVPRKIVEEMDLKKGNKIKWLLNNKTNEITLEVYKDG